MMIKKYSLILMCLLIVLLVLTSCKPKTTSMDFIKTPDEIILSGDRHKEEISKLTIERKKLKEAKTDFEKQKELEERIFKLLNESTLHIEDKEFINKIVTALKSSDGYVESVMDVESQKMLESKEFFQVQFMYHNLQQQIENGANNDVANFIIFNNGVTYIPVSSKETEVNKKVSLYKVKLSEAIIRYISEYYSVNI